MDRIEDKMASSFEKELPKKDAGLDSVTHELRRIADALEEMRGVPQRREANKEKEVSDEQA